MRTFIAIEFNEQVRKYLSEQQQALMKYVVKGNFTRKENFHLTLSFIGEVNSNQIQFLKEIIDSAASDVKAFRLSTNSIGQFSRGNKAIIWTGLNESKELIEIFNNLVKMLNTKGFQTEKRGLNPHITLGREVVLNTSFEKVSQQIAFPSIEINADKLSLMESKREEGVLKYTPIYSKELN